MFYLLLSDYNLQFCEVDIMNSVSQIGNSGLDVNPGSSSLLLFHHQHNHHQQYKKKLNIGRYIIVLDTRNARVYDTAFSKETDHMHGRNSEINELKVLKHFL